MNCSTNTYMKSKRNLSIVGGHLARWVISDLGMREACWINDCGLAIVARKTKGHGTVVSARLVDVPGWTPPSRSVRRRYPALMPKQTLMRRLNYFFTGIRRVAAAERLRQSVVLTLDKLVLPLRDDKRFLKAVERREKTVGLSDYSTMSVDSAHCWIAWVHNWMKRNIK